MGHWRIRVKSLCGFVHFALELHFQLALRACLANTADTLYTLVAVSILNVLTYTLYTCHALYYSCNK